MSEVKTNKLTGTTSAGDVDVVDGSITMQLQNGLVKCSLSGDFSGGTTTSGFFVRSLNISSVTDGGAGIYYPITFTNPFSAADHTGTGSNGTNVLITTTCQWGSYTTSTSGMGNYKYGSSAYNDADVHANWTGDLA